MYASMHVCDQGAGAVFVVCILQCVCESYVYNCGVCVCV